jgi:hypothetical protein
MTTNGHLPISSFRLLERSCASVPKLDALQEEILGALGDLQLPAEKLHGKRIAVSVGSRGIRDVAKVVRTICGWLRDSGAEPFVFPGMGSHGGGTADGQRKILEEYGVTAQEVGAEIRASMESVNLGTTPDGFTAYMDRNAWVADGVLVMNRVKPHTGFSGKIESGLLKMIAVGMGKVEGAREVQRWGRRYGNEKVIRSVADRVLASGKILAGLAVIENELQEICAVRAARPEGLVTQEEAALEFARPLVPRIPFPEFQLLIVDQMGKNIAGTGMDTKTIGRGVELPPGEAPKIRLIYVRDLTPESAGNATGIGMADLIHERLYRKVDWERTRLNARTALNPIMARLPMHVSSDREALDLALGVVGSPEPDNQQIVWIRDTLRLNRIAISEALVSDTAGLKGWQLLPQASLPQFDRDANLAGI